jgi:hypothetical protein
MITQLVHRVILDVRRRRRRMRGGLPLPRLGHSSIWRRRLRVGSPLEVEENLLLFPQVPEPQYAANDHHDPHDGNAHPDAHLGADREASPSPSSFSSSTFSFPICSSNVLTRYPAGRGGFSLVYRGPGGC